MIDDAALSAGYGDCTASSIFSASTPGLRLAYSTLADPAIEALHHTVRLKPSGLDQQMFNTMGLALLVKGLAPAGLALAIRERLAVVGQHRLDFEGRLLLRLLHNPRASFAD